MDKSDDRFKLAPLFLCFQGLKYTRRSWNGRVKHKLKALNAKETQVDQCVPLILSEDH